MKHIKPSNSDFFIMVDDDDYDHLTKWKWSIDKHGYARRTTTKNGKQIAIYMHRYINKTPDGVHTDHINLNPLDNQKANLRNCTRSQNMMNRAPFKNNTSGVKGVSWYSPQKCWTTYISYQGNRIALGYYDKKEDAIRARFNVERWLFGDFARVR